MKDSKFRISLVTYILMLLIIALLSVIVLLTCRKLDAKERAKLEQRRAQTNFQTAD